MAHMSKRFNFDDFDRQIAEALEEHEQATRDFDRVFGSYPGQIGGVALRPTLIYSADSEPDFDSLPEPPEAA